MSDPSPDRQLLLGMVAVSQQFLKPEELIAATIAWAQEEQRQPLADTLRRRGFITESQQEIVESIVQAKSESELHESLSQTLGADLFGAVREALARIGPGETGTLRQATESEMHRFEIREALARGGLGEVFIAHDTQLNRNVALKQILERWREHPDCNERFLLEAEITGRLEHPGVVPVYALGRQADGRYYYAMRLIRGVTLEVQIKRYHDSAASSDPAARSLELRKLLRRFIDVCNTIDYAHSRGVVHRDLKPANIMLGSYGETLVVDWGLAKRVDVAESSTAVESMLVPSSGSGSVPTQYGSALGTPHYMSPEQAAGNVDQMGPATDIYGLGATFYHLLTGRPPQTDSSLQRVLEKVKRGDFPRPSAVSPDVARPLEAICLKAMQHEAEQRYASAGDLARDLESWLADERVSAYREPIASTLARSLRRHQTAVASGTVATILLCVAAVIGAIVWQQAQARQQRHAYELQQQQLQRAGEDQQRLDERRAAARASTQIGLSEARDGRFASALSFFRQGEQACADEPRLQDELSELSRHAAQMARLVDYQRYADEAVTFIAVEEDRKARILLTSALRELGVFEHADWWEHLPVEMLSAREADEIEKQAHSQLALLASLLLKSTMTPELLSRRTLGLPPPKLDVEQRRSLQGFHRCVGLAQTYRPSQWLSRLEDVQRYLFGELRQLPPPPTWRVDNFVDAQLLGAMCAAASQPGEAGIASGVVGKLLGIEDVSQSAVEYLRRASRLDPSSYLAHLMLGVVEYRRDDFDAARGSLSHAISLRPDVLLAYDLRSYVNYLQAIDTADQTVRRRLLEATLHDASVARDLGPQYELVHWLRGYALRELDQPSQAAAAYLAALQREPPIEMVSQQMWQTMLQGRDPKRVRRLSFLLPDRFEETLAYARGLREKRPGDLQYCVLEAAAALALVELDAAESAAGQALQIGAEGQEANPVLVGDAWAILGDVHRSRQRWKLAQQAYSSSLQLDPANATTAHGLAVTLEHLADAGSDSLHANLALAAYQQLATVGEADWQWLRAQQGQFRLLLAQRKWDQAGTALDALLELDRGQDWAELSEFAQAGGAAPIVEKLKLLQAQGEIAEAPSGGESLHTLPMRNGGFELGLNAYWQPWSCTQSCYADASADEQTRPGGSGAISLLIHHHSASSPGSRGVLAQVLPAQGGARYRLSLWAKGEAAGGVSIVVDEAWDHPVVLLPEGAFDWQHFEGGFQLADNVQANSKAPLTAVQIISTAPGKCWLDDLRIERVGD